MKSFEELEKLGKEVIEGKIVFYNVFFDQKHINPGRAYGETVRYRGRGASYAAKYGAVACLVRSMTSVADDEPHTGNMYYDTLVSKKKIAAVALGYKSADKLHQALVENPGTRIYLRTNCRNLDPVQSYNVVGEIRGAEEKHLYIAAGGHLDSWDIGQGAHDDGAGIVQSIEMLAAFRNCGIKPKCNIRAVAFMNEENGLAGGEAYALQAERRNEKHLTAIESDAGGFVPRGFNADTAGGLYNRVLSFRPLFAPYFADRVEKEGGGADLIAIEKLGVPCMGFIPDFQRYFDLHHSAADTFDKINRRELELGGAAITSMVYLLDRHYRRP